MPSITVRTYANLRQYTGGQPTVQVQLCEGATIGTMLEEIGIPASQTKIIFLDGRAAELDQLLQDGQTVDVFSAIGGG
jgi:molybdopterin converting factor small subunit